MTYRFRGLMSIHWQTVYNPVDRSFMRTQRRKQVNQKHEVYCLFKILRLDFKIAHLNGYIWISVRYLEKSLEKFLLSVWVTESVNYLVELSNIDCGFNTTRVQVASVLGPDQAPAPMPFIKTSRSGSQTFELPRTHGGERAAWI